MSRYQKGKTNLDFTEARDSEWHWHQLGHMQLCTLLQTDNHANTSPLKFFLQAGCPSCRPINSVKALKAFTVTGESDGEKKENRSRINKVTTTSLVAPFFRTRCSEKLGLCQLSGQVTIGRRADELISQIHETVSTKHKIALQQQQ